MPAERPQVIDPASVAYRMTFEPHPKRLRVVFNGATVAESGEAMVLHETRLPPVFYFPRAHVRMDLMQPTTIRTHCPFKGNATYWSLAVGDRRAEHAGWTYDEPLANVEVLREYVAFHWEPMDAWFEDDAALPPQEAEGGARANPFADWLLREGWTARTSRELVGRLAASLAEAGVPVWRLQLVIRTLHPQVFATDYTWWRDGAAVEEEHLPHWVLTSDELQQSPYAPILRGAGGVRRRLDGPAPELDFPILRELRARGASDYVAMPLPFSDGQVNILSLVSDRPGGFQIEDLGLVYEIMPVLSRLLEVHALRHTATSLLDTYLGRRTGERVLTGLVKRGDGQDLHAVIWVCDLRDSTALADALPREAYLHALNQFFDCTAGAVLEHGGEVLKFIGDAVLAIFPIDDDGAASGRAIAAARAARARVAEVNAARAGRGEPTLAFGLGLHSGHLTYGNVGTAGRLDFTVIGSAANEAARIEKLSKTLGTWIVLSASVAAACPDAVVSLGHHRLRGLDGAQELFTLAHAASDAPR